MKDHVKFIIWIALLIVLLVGGSLYQKGYLNISSIMKTDKTQISSATDFKTEDSSSIDVTNEIESNQDAKESNDVQSNQVTEQLQISSINNGMVGENVSVVGEIINRKDHKNGHVFLTVKDSSGEILIPIFADKNILHENLIVGNQFQFSGSVDEYQGELEIIPTKKDDIVAVLKASLIENNDKGQVKTIHGKILSKYTHPQGHIFLMVKVSETGQELDIPLFNTLSPISDNYPINSEISITGKVSIYKGKLQLIPDSLNNIEIIKMGDDSAVKTVSISDISDSNRGEMVIIKGFVKDVVDKDGHIFFKIANNGHEIKTVLFKADSQEIEGRKKRILHAESAHFEIKVLGMVDVYNGELEVIIDKVLND